MPTIVTSPGGQAGEQAAREARAADAAGEHGHPWHAEGASASARSRGVSTSRSIPARFSRAAAVAGRAAGAVAGAEGRGRGGGDGVRRAVRGCHQRERTGVRHQLAHVVGGHVRQVCREHDHALRRRVLLERERDARVEVAAAVVEDVRAEVARCRVHLGVGRDHAHRQPGLETGLHDAPQQEQHEVAARIGVEHVGEAGLAARQRLHRHQGQPPAMGTGYHRAESMSPSPTLPATAPRLQGVGRAVRARELLSFGLAAERLGLDSVAISDHFQPFRHDGGHSPASLPWLGALAASTSRVLVGTSVLTPTYRYHPAVVAQAFATLGCLAPGRIFLGLGSGEAMNEVAPTGTDWPGAGRAARAPARGGVADPRAVDGRAGAFRGPRGTARGGAVIYDLPPEPIPVWIAAGGPKGARFAGAQGGLITTSGKPRELYAERLLPERRRRAPRRPARIPRRSSA